MSDVKVGYRTLPLCGRCWEEFNPGRDPVRLKQPPAERCIWCSEFTLSGIYVRGHVSIPTFGGSDE